MKTHLLKHFWLVLIDRISVPATVFSINMIKRVQILLVLLDIWTCGVLSSFVGQLLLVAQGSRTILNVHPCPFVLLLSLTEIQNNGFQMYGVDFLPNVVKQIIWWMA